MAQTQATTHVIDDTCPLCGERKQQNGDGLFKGGRSFAEHWYHTCDSNPRN